MKTRHY